MHSLNILFVKNCHNELKFKTISFVLFYIELTLIKDNGTGCAEINKGFGLHHMEERLDMLHGSLNYNGNDGFIVEAKIPIRWGTEEKG